MRLTILRIRDTAAPSGAFRYTVGMETGWKFLLGRGMALCLFLAYFVLMPALAVGASNKGPYKSSARAGNVQIDAELYRERDQVEALIGNSLDGYLVVVKVKVTPLRPKEPVRLFKDDFVLVSSKDGQRSEPFAPEQLAGSSTMVVSEVVISGGPVAGQQNAPVWGPIGGGGSPRRVDTPTNNPSGGIGSPTAQATAVKQDIYDQKPGDKQVAWLDVLKEKVLKAGDISEPVEGLLYFPLNGKHKAKHLSLLYKGTWPKMELSFDEKK